MTGGAGPWPGVSSGSLLERVLDVGFVAPPPGGELARALLAELGDDAQALDRLDALRVTSPAALERLSRVLEHWARFLDAICLDEPLDILAALHRLRSALEQSEEAPPLLRALPSRG